MNDMKIDPTERILRCIEGEIGDRVPHMELGFNIYPTVKMTLYMDKWPVRLKNWLLKFKVYEDAIQASKEYLGFSDPVPKTLNRKIFQIDRIASGLITFPTSLEFMDSFNPFLFRLPLRLGVDMIPTLGFPSTITRGKIRRKTPRDHR